LASNWTFSVFFALEIAISSLRFDSSQLSVASSQYRRTCLPLNPASISKLFCPHGARFIVPASQSQHGMLVTGR
jgi:hypothetical protein